MNSKTHTAVNKHTWGQRGACNSTGDIGGKEHISRTFKPLAPLEGVAFTGGYGPVPLNMLPFRPSLPYTHPHPGAPELPQGYRGHSPHPGHSGLAHTCPLPSSLNGLSDMRGPFPVPSYLLLCRLITVLGMQSPLTNICSAERQLSCLVNT